MDALNGLMFGLQVAIQPEFLLAAFIGVLAGTAIGVLPGLGPVAGAAVLLPFALTLDPAAAVILIAGIYYGGMYGGSISSILLNIPGEAASVVSAFEGHPLAKKGRAGPALGITVFASFVAAMLSVVAVILFTPSLAKVGLEFGPVEYLALALGGLILLARISDAGKGWAAGLLPLAAGLALGTVGEEAFTGTNRFVLVPDLATGISTVTVAVGLFGIPELMKMVSEKQGSTRIAPVSVRSLIPSRDDFKNSWPATLRGAPLGFGFGLLPGPSATLATFSSYKLEKSVSKRKHLFGKGAIEGLAGPEAANNAASTSSIIPVLALGIPFSATLALMLPALIAQGITPGPMIMVEHPEIFWGVIASMIVGNLMLVVLNIPLIGVWVRVLRVPIPFLVAGIVGVIMIGVYSVQESSLDLYILLLIGVASYVFKRLDFELVPLLLGVVLGPMIEENFRTALILHHGDVTKLFTEPIALVIWVLVVGGIAVSQVAEYRRRAKEKRLASASKTQEALQAEAR
ncbi:tripartite tricarboxylate transporter permease [Brevibacterium linens]|uniref:tripartite tricarboxylate transporter permease n=1 Tax=Brevibacterium linens TaxID=1703 RepID=UPI0035125914